jgi:anti-anti-sigma regulatory factor
MSTAYPSGSTAAPAMVGVDVRDDGIAVVSLRGEHDLSDSSLLCDALRTAGPGSRVLVDLSECTYLDLSVVGRLITARNRLAAGGGRLELYIAPEATAMWTIARRTGLAACLRTHTSRSDAIASLSSAEEPVAEAVPTKRRLRITRR